MTFLDRQAATALEHAATDHHDCQTCHRPAGRRCHASGRTVPAHAPRLAAARALNATVGACPATAPESGGACVLPDRAAMHLLGHIAAHPTWPESGSVGWPTTPAEHDRWEDQP